MMETYTRSFKGIWIPAELWLNPNYSVTEKVLIMEIHSLSDEARGCYASNAYLAKYVNCSEKTIANTLTALKEKKIVSIEYIGDKRSIKVLCFPKMVLNYEDATVKLTSVPENGKSHSQNRESTFPKSGTDIYRDRNSSDCSFLEKKNQKRSEAKADEKNTFSDAQKHPHPPTNEQSEAQKEKEKSCAKKEKEAKPPKPPKEPKFGALPTDLNELKEKIIEHLPLRFTDKMKEAFVEYMLYRKKRRKLGDLDSLKRQINKVKDWSEADLIQAVDDTIAYNWQGLFLPKISNKYKDAPKQTFNEIQREASKQNHENLKRLSVFDDLNDLPI